MMFTPKDQLENMISNAAGQVMCGNQVAENLARVIALQSLRNIQEQQEQQGSLHDGLNDLWI